MATKMVHCSLSFIFLDHTEDHVGNQDEPTLCLDPLPDVREKAQLEVLFEFLEERLDFPAIFIKHDYGPGLKVEMIAQKPQYFCRQRIFVGDQTGFHGFPIGFLAR